MNPFRSITGLLLAFLVAVPLCCCTVRAADEPARSSCCAEKNGDQREKTPHLCACKSKEPRDEAKTFELPGDLVTPLIPVVQDLSYLASLLPAASSMANTPHTGFDPPRLLLARYSRWLI